MLNILNRSSKIAYYLYNNPEGLSSQSIARMLGVSINTLNRELRKLERDLPPGWKLTRDSGTGIFLNPPFDGKIEDVWRKFNQLNKTLILFKDIIEIDKCTSRYLIEKNKFSKATLYRRIKDIKEWLLDHDIELNTMPHYDFVGDERKIRAMLVQFYDVFYPGELINTDFTEFFYVKKMKDEIMKLISMQKVVVSVEETRRLILLMHVMHLRARKGKYVVKLSNDIQKSEMYLKISNRLHTFFPKILNGDAMRNEFSYFSVNLYAGSRPINKQKEVWAARKLKKEDVRYKWVFSFIDHISNYFHFNFDSDDTLIFDLTVFITQWYVDFLLLTNTRQNQLIHYALYYEKDPLMKIVIEGLHHSKAFLPPMETSEFNQQLNYLELFLILKASVERKKKTNFIVVGVACITKLEYVSLRAELVSTFGYSIDIRYVDYVYSDKFNYFSDYDFLISTLNPAIKLNTYIPTIRIGSIIDQKDIKTIEANIREQLQQKMSEHVKVY